MKASDLERVLAWRNHPDVRCYMFTQQEIPWEEHVRWFDRSRNDPSKRLLIVEQREVALGFVHFSDVTPGGIANWGFYTVPGAQKGAGKKIGATALNFAFQEFELSKVCGQALEYNEASIRLHKALGFQQEGVLRNQQRIDGAYFDLICFGILKNEWQ